MTLLVQWIRAFMIMDCQNSMIKILNRGITLGKLESSTILVLMIQTYEVC
jgi:hypothetical protein